MEAIKKLNLVKSHVLKDTSKVLNNDIPILKELLEVQTNELTNIHNKNDIINLFEFKNEVLKIITDLIDKGLPIKNESLINTVANLTIIQLPNISVDYAIQLDDIMKEIWCKCFKILFYYGDIEKLTQIQKFISEQEIPDIRNISLALIFECKQFKSYDIESISKFTSLSVLYDVVKIYKSELVKEIKTKILVNLYKRITNKQISDMFKDGGVQTSYDDKEIRNDNLLYGNGTRNDNLLYDNGTRNDNLLYGNGTRNDNLLYGNGTRNDNLSYGIEIDNDENWKYLQKVVTSPNLHFSKTEKLQKQRDINFAYLIFYEINFLYFRNLIVPPANGVFTNEYLMFLYSSIINEKSALDIFNILQSNDVHLDFNSGITNLLDNILGPKQPVNPLDEKYLFFILELIVKILKYGWNNQMIRVTYMMFCECLMKYAVDSEDQKAKGIIYEYLGLYCNDTEAYSMILEFFKTRNHFNKQTLVSIFDSEMTTKEYFVMSKILKFLFNIDKKLAIEMALYALRSEDPETIKSCFSLFEKVDYNIFSYINLNLNHIKRAMLKSRDLVDVIINHQIQKKYVYEDVLFINTIMSSNSEYFFDYVRLHNDFGKYMNDKFLERLVQNAQEGLCYLESNITTSTVRYIKNNEKWFNLFLQNNEMYFEVISSIYDKMLEVDDNIEVSFTDGFKLLEISTKHLFNILAKKIVFCNGKSVSKYITNVEYKLTSDVLQSYCTYLKARMFVGNDVKALIKYLVNDYEDVHGILGYYKIVTGVDMRMTGDVLTSDCTRSHEERQKDIKNNSNNLSKYKIQDITTNHLHDNVNNMNEYNTHTLVNNSSTVPHKQLVITQDAYASASDYDKLLMFFNIQDNLGLKEQQELYKIVKDEIIRINLITDKKKEDKMIYKECLLQLLNLTNIDCIVRLIEDYEDKDLLLRVNIRNIMTHGTFFNKNCVMKGKLSLQIQAVMILYYSNTWGIEVIRDWISYLLKVSKDSSDIRMIVNDVYTRHNIEIY